MTPNAHAAVPKPPESRSESTAKYRVPEPTEEKRTMQQMYKNALDYQTWIKEQLKKREKKLPPEVAKMNKKDIDAYLSNEYSSVIEKMRKSRYHAAPKFATLSKSIAEDRKEKAAMLMESAGDPNRNNPIVNPLPFVSNPYIAKHVGMGGVLKGAALQSLQQHV